MGVEKRILLVEDDLILQRAFSAVFAIYRGEFALFCATNGVEAIEILKREKIDVVLTDINMPVMNGIELLSYIQRERLRIRVLVITTNDISQIKQQFSEQNAIIFLQKPFSVPKVVQKIREKLQQKTLGFIAGITLSSFLQVLNLEKKTCSIKVQSAQGVGVLYFANGELINAVCQGLPAEPAAYRILGWDDVQLEIRSLETPGPRLIEKSFSHVLLDALRCRDEQFARVA
jgi:CheY-like chemotaxis protein